MIQKTIVLLSFFFFILSYIVEAMDMDVEDVVHAARCSVAVYDAAQDHLAVVDQNRYVFGDPQRRVLGALAGQNHLTSCGEIYFGNQGAQGVKFVTCRGTVSLEEWLRNADSSLMALTSSLDAQNPGLDAGLVHSGFLEHVNSLYNSFANQLRRSGYQNTDQLIFTGHSLGAASAVLLALKFMSDNQFGQPGSIKLVLFSSPRVGDQQFVNFLRGMIPKRNILHFYCTKDIVPGLPLNGRTSPLIGGLAERAAYLIGDWLNPVYEDIEATSIPISFLEASCEYLNISRAVISIGVGEAINWGARRFGLDWWWGGGARSVGLFKAIVDLVPVLAVTNHTCHPDLVRLTYTHYRTFVFVSGVASEDYLKRSLLFSSERNPIFRFFA